MTEKKGLQVILAVRPQGAVRLHDLQVKDFLISTLSTGELLVGMSYLSLDPYMRGRMDDRNSYAEPMQIGDVMPGEAISTVIASQHPDFKAGNLVLA